MDVLSKTNFHANAYDCVKIKKLDEGTYGNNRDALIFTVRNPLVLLVDYLNKFDGIIECCVVSINENA